MARSKKRFFIGSSLKYLVLADALKHSFEGDKDIEAVTWSDYFYHQGGSKFTYESLLVAIDQFEYAVFFVTPDIPANGGKPKKYSATANVWFEAGMFLAKYGKENVLLVQDKEEERNRRTHIISDLLGLQPELIEIPSTIRNKFEPDETIPKWSDLSQNHKNQLKDAIKLKLHPKIKKGLGDHRHPRRDVVTVLTDRTECYERGFKIIEEASKHLYSIVSYENEYNDDEFPGGLFPKIDAKLNAMKRKGVSPEKSKRMFKRWMNLANDEIAEQAKQILSKHSNYIEIKDTYCNYIEVILSEKEVLIVLPAPDDLHGNIGCGVSVKGNQVARNFLNWFNYLAEPNKFVIDSVQSLENYRNLKWEMTNCRLSRSDARCNACFPGIQHMPPSFVEQAKKLGLIKDK